MMKTFRVLKTWKVFRFDGQPAFPTAVLPAFFSLIPIR
jgi:hypothetical protein